MKIIVTQEQMNMPFSDEINQHLGYTPEILKNAGFETICLNDCFVGEKIECENGFEISGSLSNAGKLPRRVALRELNEADIEFWKKIVGEDNVIN